MRAESPIYVLQKCSAEDVAGAIIDSNKQKEPFYICDLDEVYNRIQYFKKSMPRVKIFYAVKANSDEQLLKLAVSQGIGFDCASPGEINKLRKLNVSPQSIIYAVTTKTPEQMTYARETGVRHTTFDSFCELQKLKKYWPEANLLIRLSVDSDSSYKLGEKFGCDFDTEAIDLLEDAAALGLKVIGVAFHVGSGCLSISSYEVALKWSRQLFDHEARAGRGMKIVDIGGGFLSDTADIIDQAANLINEKLEELFPDPEVQVIAEPGRYICDSAFTNYINIVNVKRVKRNDKNLTMIYINDGVIGGNFKFVEAWHTVWKFQRSRKEPITDLEEVVLWGNTFSQDDQIMPDKTILLPPCYAMDWLVFKPHGAYTTVCASTFQQFPLTKSRILISKKLWELVKDNPVFNEDDFSLHEDLFSPLPSTMPSVVPCELYEQMQKCMRG